MSMVTKCPFPMPLLSSITSPAVAIIALGGPSLLLCLSHEAYSHDQDCTFHAKHNIQFLLHRPTLAGEVSSPALRYSHRPEVQFVNESHHSISWCGAAAGHSSRPVSTMKVCSRVRLPNQFPLSANNAFARGYEMPSIDCCGSSQCEQTGAFSSMPSAGDNPTA